MTETERKKVIKEVTKELFSRDPPTLKRLYALAVKHNLDDPFGRACAAASRHQNESVGNDLELMKRFKPETAEKWRLHYSDGGSLKSLNKYRDGRSKKMKGN